MTKKTQSKLTEEDVLEAIRCRVFVMLEHLGEELGLPNDGIAERQQLEKIVNRLIGKGIVVPVNYKGIETDLNEVGYRIK